MTIYIGGHGHGQAALCEKETGLTPVSCESDPAAALAAPAIADFHLLSRALLQSGGDVRAFARRLLAENPDAVICCDEIGGGVHPLDPFERRWREETGRALELLCADRRTCVVRVWYGLPEVLK